MPTTAVMWFRRDLRLADNPALLDACDSDGVLPLFVLDPALWGPAGVTRRAYLGASLRALDASLRQRHASLSVVRGNPVRQVVLAARQVGASRVHVAADYAPYGHAPRPRGRAGARRRGHRAGPDRLAVRRRAGPGAQPVRQPLQGLHAVLEGLGGARLARPGRRPDRRDAGWRSTRPSTSPTRSCPPGSSSPRPARRSPAGGGRRTSRSTWPTTTTSGTAPTWTPPAGCRGT